MSNDESKNSSSVPAAVGGPEIGRSAYRIAHNVIIEIERIGGGGGTCPISTQVMAVDAAQVRPPEQIPSFKSMEWIRDKGWGWQATVECDRERDRDNPGLIGKVEIDGEIFECIGCSRFMPRRPIRKGELIGLVVREVR